MAEAPVENEEIVLELRDRYNDGVVKEGWLEIRREHIKTWRRHYFILKDTEMFGFKKPPAPKDYHCSPCHHYLLLNAVVKFKDNDPDHTRSIFTVTMPFTNPKDEEFTRTFSAENDEERDNWANEINMVAFNTMECVDYFRSELEGKNQQEQEYLNTILKNPKCDKLKAFDPDV